MAAQSPNHDFPADSPESLKSHAEIEANRRTTRRIQVRIPKNYHQEPVISRLISHYGVTINITAALLSANVRDDGWFDLELQGTTNQIQSALTYMNELDLEIWSQSTPEQDGW